MAVTELMRTVQVNASTSYRQIEFFLTAGVLYLVLTLATSRIGRWLETRMRNA